MWNIAICDDQPESITYVKNMLKDMDLQDIGKIFAFSDGKSMLEDLDDSAFDASIFIMDIDLGNCNGISLADKILDLRPDSQIIFMSGYTDYYEAVYDVNHIYFMNKPISNGTLKKAMSKAINKLDCASESFFVAENKTGKYIIPYTDIFTFERDRRKINVIGCEGKLLCSFYGKLEDVKAMVPETFHHCHNSILINLSKVKSLESGCFIMRDGQNITISRSHRAESQLAFARYLTGE